MSNKNCKNHNGSGANSMNGSDSEFRGDNCSSNSCGSNSSVDSGVFANGSAGSPGDGSGGGSVGAGLFRFDLGVVINCFLLFVLFGVLSFKLYERVYDEPFHFCGLVIAFILTVYYFAKAPAGKKIGIFEKRSVITLILLLVLGFQLMVEIIKNMDFVSVSYLILIILYSNELFRKPEIQEMFKNGALGGPEWLKPSVWKGFSKDKGFAAGFIFTLFCLIILEVKKPYFFTNDDNVVQFLPNILYGVKAIFSGSFPAWNPYQCTGIPLFDQGIYALTYPFIYLSYLIARFAGNENITIDVFAFLHILAGYVITYFLLRKTGIEDRLSSAGSVAFVLSGFILMAGRSWFYMLPLAVFLPLMVWVLYDLINGKSDFRWFIFGGLTIGLFYHAGNAQMWVYGIMFLYVVLIIRFFITKYSSIAVFGKLTASLCLGAAIAAPMAVPQFLLTKDLVRNNGGDGILSYLAGFLFPAPISRATLPNSWSVGMGDYSYGGHLFYAGTVFFLIAFMMFFFTIFYRVNPFEFVKKNVWLVAAFIAFVFGLGRAGILWNIFCRLPVFSKFQHPIKFLPFIYLFVILGVCLFLERALPLMKQGDKIRRILISLVFVLMFWHCLTPLTSFYPYADKPYKPLPMEVMEMIKPGGLQTQRIVCFTEGEPFFARSLHEGFNNLVPHNYTTVYKLYSTGGYEPFAMDSPLYAHLRNAIVQRNSDEDFNLLRAFGTGWIFAQNKGCIAQCDNNPNLKKVYTYPDQDIAIYELTNPAPLAFAGSNPMVPLKTDFSEKGAVVDVTGLNAGDTVTVGIVYRPGLYLYSGSIQVPLTHDPIGRLVFNVPAGATKMSVVYKAPWMKGFAAAVVFLILSLILWVISGYVEKREKIK
ncbi:MAG: hypothetical protein LWY06_17555 [Firmicutes bacterium]|nr:hypothetical protein [Bacillota bacterium]